jgi:dihydrofolate reductase
VPKKSQTRSSAKKPTRHITYGVGVSLDGYIARPDGAVDFLFMPKDYQPSMAEFMRRVDTAILGRKTYEAAKKMGGGRWGGIKPYVMSHTLEAGERDGLIFTNASPRDLVADLRKQPGKDIWLMGGGELARAFLEEDLIDELYLGFVPILIGDGLPAIPPRFPDRKFKLVENKTFSQGQVALRYERAR